MFIRQLCCNDGEILKTIRHEALKNSPEAFGSSYEEEIKNDTLIYSDRLKNTNNYFFGAFEDDEIIGIICITKNSRLKLAHRAVITSFYVCPTYRGTGIGKKLLAVILQKAYDLKIIEQVELQVVTEQYPAIYLYASMGFEVYGTEFHSMKLKEKYYNEYYMMKKL